LLGGRFAVIAGGLGNRRFPLLFTRPAEGGIREAIRRSSNPILFDLHLEVIRAMTWS